MKLVSWRCILEQHWKEKGLMRKNQERKAIIVCYAGVATAMLIKEKDRTEILDNKIEVIKTCSQQEVSQELIDQVDLVIDNGRTFKNFNLTK